MGNFTKTKRKKLESLILEKQNLLKNLKNTTEHIKIITDEVYGFDYNDFEEGEGIVEALDFGNNIITPDDFIDTMDEIEMKYELNQKN